MLENAGIRIPECAYSKGANYIINGVYATSKPDLVKQSKETIAKMDAEIARLESIIEKRRDVDSAFCRDCLKRIEKCKKIKQDCMASISLATDQMKSGIVKPFCNRWR